MQFPCRGIPCLQDKRSIGKVYNKNRSLGVIILNLNGTIVVNNDPVDDGQPQTRTAFFRGEMREKQFVPVSGANACSVICKLNADEFFLLEYPCADLYSPSLVNGIGGIFKQIDEDPANLFRVNMDGTKVGIETFFDL